MDSPFKFLDAYQADDRAFYFGRETEVEELYERVFETNLVLLYGSSGTGKTSLIRCGLANQFSQVEWLPIYLQRNDGIVSSVHTALENAAVTAFGPDFTVLQKIRSIYLDYFKPIYLIFDQLEEIFIQGDESEQVAFFEMLESISQANLSCKVILSMRGEYLDQLTKYELIVPTLFDNRLYLEPMRRKNLLEVIDGTAAAFDIEIKAKETTIDMILLHVMDNKGNVELPYLQIYLDKLYRNDLARRGRADRAIRFDPELVGAAHLLEDVLSDFLEEQLGRIEQELTEQGKQPKGIPLRILYALITQEGTKKQMTVEALRARTWKQVGQAPEIVDYCIRRFNELRIVRILGTDQQAPERSQKVARSSPKTVPDENRTVPRFFGKKTFREGIGRGKDQPKD